MWLRHREHDDVAFIKILVNGEVSREDPWKSLFLHWHTVFEKGKIMVGKKNKETKCQWGINSINSIRLSQSLEELKVIFHFISTITVSFPTTLSINGGGRRAPYPRRPTAEHWDLHLRLGPAKGWRDVDTGAARRWCVDVYMYIPYIHLYMYVNIESKREMYGHMLWLDFFSEIQWLISDTNLKRVKITFTELLVWNHGWGLLLSAFR